MGPDEIDYAALVRGETVIISKRAARRLLKHYEVRSASRLGYVLVLGDVLVRLTDTLGPWALETLPWPAKAARESHHQHAIVPIQFDDGLDVLVCCRCGMEW